MAKRRRDAIAKGSPGAHRDSLRIMLTIDPDRFARISEFAEQQGSSFAQAVRDLTDKALEQV